MKGIITACIIVAALAGCGHTHNADVLDVQMRGVGDSGISVRATADGDEVFVGTAPASRLGVDKAVARRVCALYPGVCSWAKTGNGERE